MDPRRLQRVSEALREELEELIGYEMSDPRVGGVTVTEVLVSPDSRHAQVRLSLAGDAEEQQQALQAIEGARGFLRRELTRRLKIYRIPDLHFEPDLDPELGARVGSLMKRIRKGRPKTADFDEKKPVE